MPGPGTLKRDNPPLVILVHGFLRSGLSMMPSALGLRRRGFEPRVVSQLNIHRSIPELADDLYNRVERMRDVVQRSRGERPDAHFVTHSMGGIVVRSMLARNDISGPNRVVMIAPPSQGSRFAKHMHDEVLRFPWGSFDPLRKLLPGELGECAGAGDPDAEIGVIAGAPPRASGFPWSLAGAREGSRFGFRPGPEGDHDGKVALDEARYDHAVDFLVVPHGHTFIMARPDVLDQCAAFLLYGRFLRKNDDTASASFLG